MDAQDQSQPAPDGTEPPIPAPSAERADATPSEAYPPPYSPPASHPFTSTMMPAMPGFPVAEPEQPSPGRMSRADALDLLSRLKTTLVAGSVIAFGMFAALAVSHVTGVTSRSSAATQSSSGSQGSQTGPVATAPTNDDGGGFFNSSPPSSGFGIGPPSSQAPASNTSVS